MDKGEFGFRILVYDVVESTQEVARSLGGVGEFTVIVAGEQVGGRGRFGRRWVSPRGGLWFTVILYPMSRPVDSAILGLYSALAVTEAIQEVTGLEASIRWPNDVYVNGRKVAGILVELDVMREAVRRALIGIGVNANFPSTLLPADLRDKATTLLEEIGERVDTEKLLIEMLGRLKGYYELYRAGRSEELMEAVKRRMELVGRKVLIERRGEETIGVVKDLEADGGLVLELGREEVKLSPSEVSRLRPI